MSKLINKLVNSFLSDITLKSLYFDLNNIKKHKSLIIK